jgi:hypothetical protein
MASSPEHETIPSAVSIALDAETLRKMVEEYTGAQLAEILRAVNGLPEPERLLAAPESPWASVVFILSTAAVLITVILKSR